MKTNSLSTKIKTKRTSVTKEQKAVGQRRSGPTCYKTLRGGLRPAEAAPEKNPLGVCARHLHSPSSRMIHWLPGLMAPSQFAAGGALLSLNPGTLGGALSPALMSNSTLATIQALASGGSLPITSLDATGNLVFANAGGAPNIVTAPLFLNPQNLSLLTSNPVSLVSAAAASAGNSGPVASLHATSTSAESIQNSLFTVASASGAASTTTTASKAQ